MMGGCHEVKQPVLAWSYWRTESSDMIAGKKTAQMTVAASSSTTQASCEAILPVDGLSVFRESHRFIGSRSAAKSSGPPAAPAAARHDQRRTL